MFVFGWIEDAENTFRNQLTFNSALTFWDFLTFTTFLALMVGLKAFYLSWCIPTSCVLDTYLLNYICEAYIM